MTRRMTTIALLFAALLAGACGGDGEKTQAYDAGGGLVFEVPVEVLPEGSPGQRSAGTLAGPDLRLSYEFGGKVRQPAQGRGDVRVSLLSIDGRAAYVEYYTDADASGGMAFVATLYVADAGGGKSLAMVVHASDEDGQGDAKRIFRSIEFPEDAPAGAG